MSAEDVLEVLARSILEGTAVDWERVEAESESWGGAGRVRALREVARIVAFNLALQRDRDGVETNPPRTSRTSSDREGRT
jgi:hypothetical protein